MKSERGSYRFLRVPLEGASACYRLICAAESGLDIGSFRSNELIRGVRENIGTGEFGRLKTSVLLRSAGI